MITFECEKCGHNFKVGDEHAGKEVLCKNCRTLLTVPAAGGEKHDTWFDPNYDTCSLFMHQNQELIQALLKQEREGPRIEVQTAGQSNGSKAQAEGF